MFHIFMFLIGLFLIHPDCKDSENRAQYKAKSIFFVFIVKVHPIFDRRSEMVIFFEIDASKDKLFTEFVSLSH